MSLKYDLTQLKRVNSLNTNGINNLKLRLSKITLLGKGHTNAKLSKGSDLPFNSYILYLSPGSISGINFCPSASAGCLKACLYTAGRGKFKSVSQARLRKSLYFRYFKDDFLNHLHKELISAESQSKRRGLIPVVRLNGTSDIPWHRLKLQGQSNLFELFPGIQFYDYTKVLPRLSEVHDYLNYHLTYSASELSDWSNALKYKTNVAMVFNKLPRSYMGIPVHDGDTHDFRFLDPEGVIVGLKAKGEAKKDKSGFVR